MAGKRKAGAAKATTRPPGKAAPQKSTQKTTQKTKRNGKPKKVRTRGQKVRRALLYLVVSGLVAVLLLGAGFFYVYQTTELPDSVTNDDFQTETSFVYYADGKTELGQYAVQNRDAITYDEMPQTVKDAVVAAENRSFWTDNGIDMRGIIRAAFSNAQGNATQGASTITQQYIKILYLTQERSYQRKLKEAILSLKLKNQMSKEEILTGYLNTIYFGRGAYGIQAAALAYFQVPAAELDLKQSAALASIINNPNYFDPDNGKDAKIALRERYRYVLDGMAQAEDISADEAQQASKRLPKFQPEVQDSTYGGQKGHVLTMVKSELLKLTDDDGNQLLDEDTIDGGGLEITTTFTKKAMDAAENGVTAIRPKGKPFDQDLHVGVATVDVTNGAVLGIYGGQDYLESQLNWAVEGGMAGSSLKPFALAAGIKAGYSLKDTFDGNSPFELPDGSGEVENQGFSSYGSAVNLIKATEDSINTAFVDLTTSIPDGPQKVMEMMNAMGIPPKKAPKRNAYGIPTDSPGLEPFAGIALGSATVSPINMANGYATIANGGRFHEPFVVEKVVDRNGTTLYDHSQSDEQVIDEDQGADIAADVSYAMQQVVDAGSGTVAQDLGYDAAGKTGTATFQANPNDAPYVSSSWFSGFTPQIATSVMYVRGKGQGQLDGWLPPSSDGRDGYFGGNYPAKTWTEVMKADMDGLEEMEFPEPAYVDGEAPDEGHSPTTAPPPPSKPTKKPTESETQKPTDKPTREPTTEAPPTTSAPPPPPPTTEVPPTTSAPPPVTDTPTPTATCSLLGCDGGTQTPQPTPSPRLAAGARETWGPWAWWSRMRW